MPPRAPEPRAPEPRAAEAGAEPSAPRNDQRNTPRSTPLNADRKARPSAGAGVQAANATGAEAISPTASGSEANPLSIALIPVLQDNYVFVLWRGRRAAVVDPAVAPPVRAWLEERRLELEAVLQTHHHSDHIGGTPELLRRWPRAAVIASAADRERIPFQTLGVADGDRLQLLDRELMVLAVPGHTRHHLAYHLPPDHDQDREQAGHSSGGQGAGEGDLFCGDTLFAGGCGRLFEGTPAQMHASLQRLASLPERCRVWCAHEYTATNLAWAAAQRPEDAAIAERLAAVRRLRAVGQATIPSSIGLEKATNLFIRAADAEALAALRQSRNHWQG